MKKRRNVFIGIDQHKRYSIAVTVDSQGKVLSERHISHCAFGVQHWLRDVPREAVVALEATGFYGWLADLLQAHGLEVHLAHPLKVKPFAEQHIKTDRVDAHAVAQLLRLHYLPEAYLAPPEVRRARELLRSRAGLVRIQTQIKNRIRSYLDAYGITLPLSRRFSSPGKALLRALSINGQTEKLISLHLDLLEALQQKIAMLETMIDEMGIRDQRIALLESVPGIGTYLAGLIVAEIGDITRFHRSRQLISYAGLNPSVWSSGGHTRYGPISKEGSAWLRYAFTQPVNHAIRTVERWKKTYTKLKARKGPKAAHLEIGRRICCAVFYMLSKNITFTDYLTGTDREPR